MPLFSREQIEAAAALVYQQMPPTPQYSWPLLNQKLGFEVWVKHENHTPIGAFKIRGGITYVDWLKRTQPDIRGICTATRGNHGQSQAKAATSLGLKTKVFVPEGNSVEKNAAMAAFGAEVVVSGKDYDEASDAAKKAAEAEGLSIVPSFHTELVRGVSTYALEFFTQSPALATVYVPIGCGSGICGVIAARDALGLRTKIVGVVSERAQAPKLSAEAGVMIETESAKTFADGIAVRIPVKAALDIYSAGAERFVAVSDDDIAEAMRLLYTTTHNVAEGAGAAPLAGLLKDRDQMRGQRVGIILCGGNIDRDIFVTVLNGETPICH